MLDLAVIAPTKNEAGNIEPFLKRLRAALSGLNYKIIFVDDSKDETPKVIEKLLGTDAVLVRRTPEERNGLGNAVVRGFKEAKDARHLSALNVDLQHPPEVIRRLYDKAIETGADMVLPSRYIGGGSSEGLNKWYRHLFSALVRYFVRALFIFKLGRVTDPGSGMYLLKREVIEGVDLKPIGYKILLEMLIKGKWSKIVEVSYVFEKRFSGQSKLTFGRAVDFGRHLLKLLTYNYLYFG